ncbi:MAG: redoxin domain-containing protein [Nitrospiraceae bacterium]|nr:redoxin domain-containing protein [Nitrospiraceae bacterium]
MEGCCALRIGDKVPDFRIDTFEPADGSFGEISLEELKKQGKWTILFFYPADFTFV